MATFTAMGCQQSRKEDAAPGESGKDTSASMPFFLGTYTAGESQGIYKYLLQSDGSLEAAGLMATAENPSFLAFSWDGNFLLAVNEVSDENEVGYLSSFRVMEDTLAFLDRRPTGGAHPCHVIANAQGYVAVANYSGGNMGLLQIQDDGRLSELLDVQQHKGKGVHPRQEGPHAHSGGFDADGTLISVDLGTNQLWFSEIDAKNNKFSPLEPPTLSMDPGAGPRHLAFHPQHPWIYVINELSSSVSLIKKDPATGTYRIEQTLSTLPEGFSEENTCADIHLSPEGDFLYASNRGHNSIAIFAVDPRSGVLRAKGHEPVRGEKPRNFSLSPDGRFLLVANQDTDNLVSFKRDAKTGQLAFADEIPAPTPVCILFANLPSNR